MCGRRNNCTEFDKVESGIAVSAGAKVCGNAWLPRNDLPVLCQCSASALPVLCQCSASALPVLCQCSANADGKKICKHVVAIYRLLDIEWWKGRIKKRIQIMRPKLRCPNDKCRSKDVIRYGKRKNTRKNPVQKRKCNTCGHFSQA